MVVINMLGPSIVFLAVICLSYSSRLDVARSKRAQFMPRYLTTISTSKCSTIVTEGCCHHSSCCLSDCCCDQVCHDPTFNDCCSDIADVGCFPDNAPRNCSAAGYIDGCCVEGSNETCFVPAGNCSCALSCHQRGNCCPDITAIGCAGPMNCSAAGHTNGCCVGSSDQNKCYVAANNCSCDIGCYHHGNCCPDIKDVGCHAPSPPTTPPPITGCVSAGHRGGCCTGRNCVYRIGITLCRCDQNCYNSIDRRKRNRCCKDIKEIQCYPQTCRQAQIKENCQRTRSNNCSFQIAHNGSLCYCGEGCITGARCCNSMKYLEATASRFQIQLIKMQKVISNLQEDVGKFEDENFVYKLSNNINMWNYILARVWLARSRRYKELSHHQELFDDKDIRMLSHIVDEDLSDEKENITYGQVYQLHRNAKKIKTLNNYLNKEKRMKQYLANIMEAIRKQH